MPERIYRHEEPFARLRALMALLRVACPWDREQTLCSLRPHTLEEAHEVIEAAERAEAAGDARAWEALRGELGDLLLQVAFYAVIAEEAGAFDLAAVVDGLIDKMVRRHPHVFGDARPDDLLDQWERLKAAEQQERDSLMDGIPPLPALARAQKMQQRAARVGFDWPDARGVLKKVGEEVAELHEALAGGDARQVEGEFGDLLFTLVNLGRKLGVDSESALLSSCRKFADRVRAMEREAARRGDRLDAMDAEQLEALYRRVKRRGGSS
ncbi:MAG: nucleoside triphosphate pyrophosphohydrolase [Zetaproteobacteria bacterium]|nr:MAG: nucleoside triphosphate pyrophosphohydrolase [Zetaproteobacteria bacterium]